MSISYEEALGLLLDKVNQIAYTESVDLVSAGGRIIAEKLVAPFDQPPFARSPLDGYAVRSSDIAGASREKPAKLTVISEVVAGYEADTAVETGTAIRIMTGAPIPEGADCVIMQEDTDYGKDTVEIYKSAGAWQNICEQGEDFRQGDVLIQRGEVLNPACIGVLASVGRAEVTVYKKPRVLLLSTGDELLLPGEPTRRGAIYNSNLFVLQAQLLSWGAEIVYAGQISDNPEDVVEIFCKYQNQVDLIVTTGGVSVGKKDIMHDVFRMSDIERIFWRVDIKPGMPILAGDYMGIPVVALSGNPFGVVVTSQLFVRTALCKMTGDPRLEMKWRDAVLDNEYSKKSKARRFVRSKYADGYVRIVDGANGNGTLSTVCHCNCFLDIPAGSGALRAGEKVAVLMI